MTSTRRDDSGLGANDLSLTGFPTQLPDRFVEKPITVKPSSGKLSPVWIQHEVATLANSLAPVDERTALTYVTESERLYPGKAVEAEAIV